MPLHVIPGCPPRQRGAATLLISLVMLVAMTLLAVVMARSSLIEIRASANSYRAKQAVEAAEAGLNFGLAHYQHGGADQDDDGVADTLFPADTDGDGDPNTTVIDGKVVEARYCTPGNNPPATCVLPTDLNNVLIFAQGWSDDRVAVHRMRQLSTYYQALPNGPLVPLVAKSASTMKASGNLTIVNNESNTTIWMGDAIDTATGSFNTFIQVDGVDNTKSSEKAGAVYTLGPDVIHNDATLKTATLGDFFANFFGASKTDVRAKANVVINAGAGETLTAGLHGDELIYIDNASGGFTVNQNLGTLDHPVVLVVDGPLTIAGSSQIYGVVYTTLLDHAAGTADVFGSLIAEDIDDAVGGFTVTYKGSVIEATEQIGRRAPLTGSWRDF